MLTFKGLKDSICEYFHKAASRKVKCESNVPCNEWASIIRQRINQLNEISKKLLNIIQYIRKRVVACVDFYAVAQLLTFI